MWSQYFVIQCIFGTVFTAKQGFQGTARCGEGFVLIFLAASYLPVRFSLPLSSCLSCTSASLLSCAQKFARYIVDRSQATELLLFTLQTLIREQALYDQSQREEQQADMDEDVTVEIEVDELRQKVCMLSC